MVRRAGGWELLGREGERSAETTWERVREVDPEQLILALCGFDASRAARELEDADRPDWFDGSARRPRWRAVRGRRIGLFSRPGPRIVEGIAMLAELFDPEGFAGSGPFGSWIPLGPVGIGSGRAD